MSTTFDLFCAGAEDPPTPPPAGKRTGPSSQANARPAAGSPPKPAANSRIALPPKVKRLPASGTIGAGILAALAEGKTMTTEQIQEHLPEHLPQSVQAEISALHRKGLIGENSKVGKKAVWGRT